jgi:hypothetical protein
MTKDRYNFQSRGSAHSLIRVTIICSVDIWQPPSPFIVKYKVHKSKGRIPLLFMFMFSPPKKARPFEEKNTFVTFIYCFLSNSALQ